MNPIQFVDTTVRDGNQSLWAAGMRTDMILPVIEQIDSAGYVAIELFTAAFIKKMVRELKEDPWERIRQARARANTPLRAILGRHTGGFGFTPKAMSDLYLQRLVAHGIREVRISDSSNTPHYWVERLRDANAVGLKCILNLVYSISPVHTDEYYRDRARQAARLDVFRICLKDPGGLLTPDRTRVLAQIVVQEANGIPVEFHTHCNTGLGPLCALDAIKAGIKIINVAIPPLANGSSNPSVFNVAENAAALGYDPQIDLDRLRPVSAHFNRVAAATGLPVGAPHEYQESHFSQQVPGGMISNLRHQLGLMKMADRLPEVLEEIGRVREDFGFPIMVTPYSQFVGVQATLNVITSQRYSQLAEQTVQFALGLWGDFERDAMKPELRDQILDSPRARELAGWVPPDPSLADMRKVYGGAGVSDDEMLLRYFAGADAVTAMRAEPPRSDLTYDARRPLVDLVTDLVQKSSLSEIRIERPGLMLHMAKS